MSKLSTYIRDRHAILFKALLFVATIAVIIFQFPREGKFKYDLNNLRGKPWPYEDLTAPFSFPILKSQEDLDKEKALIKEQSPLYYNVDTDIPQQVPADLLTSFEARWEEYRGAKGADTLALPTDPKAKLAEQEHLKSKAVKILTDIYSVGLIQLDEHLEGKPDDFEVFLIRNNIAEATDVGSLMMLRKIPAYVAGALADESPLGRSFLQGLLENAVRPNVIYDAGKTESVLRKQLDNISLSRDMVKEGDPIIERGAPVDDDKLGVLQSLKHEYEAQLGSEVNYYYILAGQIILVALSMLILGFFLLIFRRDIIVDHVQLTFILLLLAMTVTGATLVVKAGQNIYLVPFCFLPVVIRAFFDTRLALFTHLTAVLISSIISANGFEFVFLQFVAGNAAIYSLTNMRNRSQLFVSALVIFLGYSVTYLGILVIQEGAAITVNPNKFKWFAISASSILLVYPMIYIFEKIFGLVSDVTLMELADLNSPLLRRLATETPGTFQHSLQVANLAEEAIHAIGGDALLVRTGALYHDIGKMEASGFFIENQGSGINPHDDLPEEESARIIIHHVIKGIEMARKQKLPEKVIDFIRTHHGTTRTEFFLRRYADKHPGEKFDETMFQYPGPKPFSRETSVLMMADACEAASRSLRKPDKESISKMVEGIIGRQVSTGQFSNANITLKDISTTQKIIIKRLLSIYHVRVAYPGVRAVQAGTTPTGKVAEEKS
ncbi:MAG: HDIG domain-containing protein [Flavobacteriales bacterium]|nr:HDIG domain-containing protein [Flavobacteriales bacterium]